jgi:hypothetical protein
MEHAVIRRRGRPPKNESKTPTSFRLSATARSLLAALAHDSGLSHASVIEVALRDLAKRRGVKPPSVAALYGASLATRGDLTASVRFQEDVHEYSPAELADMEAGAFEKPLH